MAILRNKSSKDFTTVNNSYLKDAELSWKAKGMITYLMSLPDDWKVNISDLKNRSKEGRDAVKATLNEIIENGYGRRIKNRNKSGQFDNFDFEVSDIKIKKIEKSHIEPLTGNPLTGNPLTGNPLTGNPLTGNPLTGNPLTGNPELINTNSSKDLLLEKTNNIEFDLFGETKLKESDSKNKFIFKNALLNIGVNQDIVNDFMQVRRKKKATDTKTAFTKLFNEIKKSGFPPNEVIKLCVEKDWKGFEAEWLLNMKNNNTPKNNAQNITDNDMIEYLKGY